MISYLPEIYPDELVYSWFCRYYIHSGCFSHKMAMAELYCKRSDNPSKEFIGNLNEEARKKIESMYSMKELILNHTMFPQYARFIPLEQKKEAVCKLEKESGDVHHLFCVLPRGIGEQYLRYCPLCAAEDREKYGETYWHRNHQIRNMNICTKHKCKLEESNVTARSEQTFIFCPAENHIENKSPVYENNIQSLQFAEYMEQAFNSKLIFQNDIPISSILYHGMSRTKYMKSSGRSRYTKKFVEDMVRFYEEIEVGNIASIYQVQRTLLGDRFDFSIVCQIAFFLGMNVEELIYSKLTKNEIKQEQNSHYQKDAVPINWDELDVETAPILEQIAYDIYNGISSGRPERVSEKLLYRELNLQSHRLENMPRCRAVYEKYKESYPESWARKVIWAYEKLMHETEGNIYWSDIRKISGVKKHNFETIVPYLRKYTDEKTANIIISMVS